MIPAVRCDIFFPRLENYYTYLIENIHKTESSDFLEEERGEVLKKISSRELTPVQVDNLRRKQNILHKFIDEIAMFLIHRDGIDTSVGEMGLPDTGFDSISSSFETFDTEHAPEKKKIRFHEEL
ncbi:hypothetical protein Ahia01_000095800 [Argonauta hians]